MSWARRDTRLDLGSLLAAAGVEPKAAHEATHREVDGWHDYNVPTRRPPAAAVSRSVERLAEHLGTTSRTLHRCAATGLSPMLADRCATRLGMHPANIWPDWYAVAEDHAPRSSHAA